MITVPPAWLAEASRITGATPVEFIEAAFADASGAPAPVRIWTGIGDRTWNGVLWTGVGNAIELAPIPAASAVDGQRAWSVSIPADATMIAAIATARTHGRLARLWLGWLDANGNLIDPVLMTTVVIDEIVVEDTSDQAVIRITCVDTIDDLDRPRLRRLSPETQAQIDPTDRGMDYVSAMDRATVDVARGYWRREARRAG